MNANDASSAQASTGDDPVIVLSRLWRRGQPPDLAEYLKQHGPLEAATLVAVLRVDQAHRWQRGERIPAEAYFRSSPALEGSTERALELIYGEYLLREELGERPLLSEFALRFPQHAERLRQQVELHQAIDSEPSVSRGSGVSSDERHTYREAAESAASHGDETWKNTPGAAAIPGAISTVPGYEILRLLGRGGMGVVYLARQKSLNRQVALKMLPGGPVDPEERARFRVEAETVARLQHPHIVQIHEVGDCGGRPYLSLEYVAGGSLAQHLAGRPQPPRDAAQLIETLARAIHYAHQRGVVHRDLKPANVLLSAIGDRQPALGQNENMVGPIADSRMPMAVKITDFGLAKLLDRRERDQTQTGVVIGTPSYMSPEQALGRTRDIGTPADVYALGAILYEALTGRPPFEAESSLLTLQQVAHMDPTLPRQLQPGVPRDLETICLKCLAKDPARRYGSAEALADDLQRFLAGQPIQARRVGALERFHKWTRRHPALAGLLLVGVLSSVLLLGGGWWAYVQLRKSAEQTQQSFQDALDAVDQMLTEVADVDLDEIPQMETKRRELLQRAQAFYDRLLSRRGDDPRLQLENVHARIRSGEIHDLLGDTAEALAEFEDALAGLDRYRDFNSERARELRAEALRKLALVRKGQALLTEAEASLRVALEIHQQLASEHGESPWRQRDLARTHYDLAAVLAPQSGRESEAELAYRESLRLVEDLHARYPDYFDSQRDEARTLNNLAIHLRALGRPDAEATFSRAAMLQQRIVDSRVDSRRDRHLLARTLSNLGAFRLAAQDYPQGEQHYRQARDLWQKLRDDFPSTPLYQRDLAMAHHNLGLLYRMWKRPEQACAAFEAAIRLRERLATDAPIKDNRIRLANSQTSFAVYLREAGQTDAAADWYRAAHGTLTELLGKTDGLPEHECAMGVTCYNWGLLLAAKNRYDEAEPLAREAVQRLRKARASRREYRPYQDQLCEALTLSAIVAVQLKDHARAVEAASELPRVLPEDYAQHVRAARFLSQCVGLAPGNTWVGLREEYALRALQSLRQAIVHGFKGIDQLKTETDFDPLRTRDDFRELLKSLEDRVKSSTG